MISLFTLLLIAGGVFEGAMIVALVFFMLSYIRFVTSDMSLIYMPGNRVKRIFHNLRMKDRFVDDKKFYEVDADATYRNEFNRVVTTHWYNEPTALKVSKNRSEWINSEGVQRIINNQVIKDIVTPKDEKERWIVIVLVIVAFVILAVVSMVALKIFGVWK